MIKKILGISIGCAVIGATTLLSSCAPPPPPQMWTCYAKDARGATWQWAAYRRRVAHYRVMRLCRWGSYAPTCTARCVPPKYRD